MSFFFSNPDSSDNFHLSTFGTNLWAFIYFSPWTPTKYSNTNQKQFCKYKTTLSILHNLPFTTLIAYILTPFPRMLLDVWINKTKLNNKLSMIFQRLLCVCVCENICQVMFWFNLYYFNYSSYNFLSLRKRSQFSKCFVLSWNTGFSSIWIVELLSHCIVKCSFPQNSTWFTSSSLRPFLLYIPT